MNIISLQQASDHLRLDLDLNSSPPTDPRIPELEEKIDAAQAIIVNYLRHDGESPEWEPTGSDLPIVRAATLLLLTALWDDRTADDASVGGDYIKHDGAIARLLARMRKPTLA